MRPLRVHLLPQLIAGDFLIGKRAVVIDVLRATTVIVQTLGAGARVVVPCLSIDEARMRAAQLPTGEVVLGGERHGLAIEGFDLGNSPAEYMPQRVGGKTVVITTTNGTRALLHCRQGIETVIAGFVNLSAVRAVLAEWPEVDVLCAGTDGEITREDVLVAGAIVEELAPRGPWQLNDAAAIARDAWLQVATGGSAAGDRRSRLIEALRGSQGGRNLIAIGLTADIDFAAEIDRLPIVPSFDPASGQIVAQAPGRPGP